MLRTAIRNTCLGVLFVAVPLSVSSSAAAQESRDSDPARALSAALAAACRANESEFANYLTSDNAAAFRALPEERKAALLKRFSLTDGEGKPLLSSDAQNHAVLRCQAPEETVEFRFGNVRTRENLAFIPVTVIDSQTTEFGLVRENGSWRLLSLGLVLLDISQLSKQWDTENLASREDAVVDTMRKLAAAIQSYRRAFDKLPESLSQLGPAPKGQISPEEASLVSQELATGKADGYQLRYRIVPAADESEATFELAATPEEYGTIGQRSFFLDGEGKIHGADKRGSVAAATDPLIDGEKAP